MALNGPRPRRGDKHVKSEGPGSTFSRWIVAAVVVVLLGLVAFYLALVLGGYGLRQPRPARKVNLTSETAPAGASPAARATGLDRAGGPTLRVAVAPIISPEKTLALYSDLAVYVASRLGAEAEVLQRRTYSEVNELVRYRQCDMAFVCTYPFVRGERDFGMEALAVPQVDGRITYRALIIVPAGSSAESLSDLRGTHFARADLMSNTGWLYPATWLMERDEDPKSFFSHITEVGSHDRAIEAVALGFVDGAAVDGLVYRSMAEADSTIAGRVKVIQKSPPFGMPPVVTNPLLDDDVKLGLREILTGMHEDPRGKAILSLLGIDKFVVPDLEIYESVREAALMWESRE